MRKNFLLLSATLMLAGMGGLVSCEKKQEEAAFEQVVTAAQSAEGAVPEEDFEKVLENTMKSLDGTNHMVVRAVEGGYTFQILDGEINVPAERVYCKSRMYGYTFANCVAHNIRIHGCVQVTFSEGYYYGSSCG
ncbi:hypothetical protein EJV47_13970 [Hymenobacter gummosus]|uniref:Lipoprotein n=1 Tax=Hymenobacter gummosus TaxID=1776032 RepID=A0A431U235_9BACT|nr:hypothetical protein [Hymenobacter gummosus]RTQ49246.1 hypothetical protein EJV47_13970 [Hymenobacter gummosus]